MSLSSSLLLLCILRPSPLLLQKCGLGTEKPWLPHEQEAGLSNVEPQSVHQQHPDLFSQPLFLPLVLVVDSRLYRRWGSNLTTAHRLCEEVGKAAAEVFAGLGLRVVIVEVEEWATTKDKVRIVPEADVTLERFLEYREKMRDR